MNAPDDRMLQVGRARFDALSGELQIDGRIEKLRPHLQGQGVRPRADRHRPGRALRARRRLAATGRTAGAELRLADTTTGLQLWAEDIAAPADLDAVQDEVTARVARSLSLRMAEFQNLRPGSLGEFRRREPSDVPLYLQQRERLYFGLRAAGMLE